MKSDEEKYSTSHEGGHLAEVSNMRTDLRL